MHNNLIHSLILIYTKMSKNKYTFLEIEQKRMICIYDKKTQRNYTKTIDSSFHKEISIRATNKDEPNE